MKPILLIPLILFVLPIADANTRDNLIDQAFNPILITEKYLNQKEIDPATQATKEIFLTYNNPVISRRISQPHPDYFRVEWQTDPETSREIRFNTMPKWSKLNIQDLQNINQILPDADSYGQVCVDEHFKADSFGGYRAVTVGNTRFDPRGDATSWAVYGFNWDDTGSKYGLNKLKQINEGEKAYLVLRIKGIESNGRPIAEQYTIVAKEPVFGIDEGAGTVLEENRHYDKGQRVVDPFGGQIRNFISGGGISYLGPTQGYDWAGNAIDTSLRDDVLTNIEEAPGRILDTITTPLEPSTEMRFDITDAVLTWQEEQRDGTIIIGLANPELYKNKNQPDGFLIIGSSEGDDSLPQSYITIA